MKETKKKKLYQRLGVDKLSKIGYLTKKSIYFAWHRHHFLIPPKALKKYMRSFFTILQRGGNVSNLYTSQKAYLKWREEQGSLKEYKDFDYKPLLSVIIPVYNVSRQYLVECLDSILEQSYQNFEICIADDCSTNEETLNTLKEYEKKDNRVLVTYRKNNGMISLASNTAIKKAKGEFIILVDNDDTVDKDAFYYIVEALNNDRFLDMVYTDEDKIDFNGNYFEPHFKPDYSPDTFMGVNYICHLTCLRKDLVLELGGFRKEYDGSQDYDLFLRVVEKTNKICHIPKILYHWRQTPTSTAGYLGNKNYAYVAGKRALEDSLKRRNIKGEVLDNPDISTYLIRYHHDSPLVSIIIPIKDKASMTRTCLEGLYSKNSYKNFEIILVDNNSEEKETKVLLEEYQEKYDNFRVLRIEKEFNYSYLNNEAVKIAKGDYLLLLNNDTEVLDSNFLDEMVGYASQEHVGCVGLKLLYKDKKVQHAGVVLGYGDVAGHVYVACSNKDVGLMGRLAMPYDYSAVTAACLMVKKSKYEEVDGFDENLRVGLNDVDFNLKLLSKGYYNVCLSNVEMFHYESKSRGYEVSVEKQERYQKEKEYILEKWQDEVKKDRFFSKNNF